MKRNRLLSLVFCLLLGIIITLWFTKSKIHDDYDLLLSDYNQLIKDYNLLVEKHNNYIDEVDIKLTEIEQNSEYSTKLNQNPIGFSYDGKSISTEELLEMFNEIAYELDSISNEYNTAKQGLKFIETKYGLKLITDSDNLIIEIIKDSKIDELKDSEYILKNILERYPIRYMYKNNLLSFPFNRVDSALHLYPYFKQNLKREGDKIIISH